MSQNIRISAVIPAYNAESTLARAVESVLKQTRPADEIIGVDDGSTDRTADVARSFGDRVRCIRQANGGAAAARNRGILEAQGDWIAFLDADDVWTPRHLHNAAQIALQYPDLAWIGTAYDIVYPAGRRETRCAPDAVLCDGAWFRDYFEAVNAGVSPWTSALLIRRDVLRHVGLFDSEYAVGEDLDLWFRIGLEYPRMGWSNEPTALYCLSGNSLTTQTLSASKIRTFLKRIRKSERLAAGRGPEAVARSEGLIRQWVGWAFRMVLLDGDHALADEVRQSFGRRLSLQRQVILRACRLTPRPVWSLLVHAVQGARKVFRNRVLL